MFRFVELKVAMCIVVNRVRPIGLYSPIVLTTLYMVSWSLVCVSLGWDLGSVLALYTVNSALGSGLPRSSLKTGFRQDFLQIFTTFPYPSDCGISFEKRFAVFWSYDLKGLYGGLHFTLALSYYYLRRL